METERIRELDGNELTYAEFQYEARNLIESLCGTIAEQSKKIQELEDEINRLKGEKGKPKFNKGRDKGRNGRSKNKTGIGAGSGKEWSNGSKLDKIKIDRVEVVRLEKEVLPEDIEFKGYDEKVIQNIVLKII